jgi:phosphopantothenoylcysteine decarboxylase/phosphopantothenate--cysteine ligase
MDISFIKNPDIVSDISTLCNKPFTVGFAAETQENNESLEKIAFEKLQRKKLDLIIANNISSGSIGFDSDYNSVVVIDENSSEIFPRIRKTQLSRQLISKISQKIKIKNKEL